MAAYPEFRKDKTGIRRLLHILLRNSVPNLNALLCAVRRIRPCPRDGVR